MTEQKGRELRLRDDLVLGLLMDQGPLTPAQIRDHFYPDGMTVSRNKAHGPDRVPKTLGSINQHLTSLSTARGGGLVSQVGDAFQLCPGIATAWVVYVGSASVYVGIYDALCAPIALPNGEPAFRAIPAKIWERDLETVLRPGLAELADLAAALGDSGRPDAMAVGLPAVLARNDSRIVGAQPKKWNGTDVIDTVSGLWRRHEKAGVAALPRLADGRLAITVDTDVVMDTLAAMYDWRHSQAAEIEPRRALVVLGVKHSEGIRSAVVTRGASDLSRDDRGLPTPLGGLLMRRPPGHRRDPVYRGAFGDTQGLGHAVALIHRARAKENDIDREEMPDWKDVVDYFRDGRGNCSCRSDEPHLDGLASLRTVENRLDLEEGVSRADGFWVAMEDEIRDETEVGQRAR